MCGKIDSMNLFKKKYSWTTRKPTIPGRYLIILPRLGPRVDDVTIDGHIVYLKAYDKWIYQVTHWMGPIDNP